MLLLVCCGGVVFLFVLGLCLGVGWKREGEGIMGEMVFCHKLLLDSKNRGLLCCVTRWVCYDNYRVVVSGERIYSWCKLTLP